jgi:cellulose synthase/poly-beta-1,6-N-acetylglucosamine synthase-like glycosyltransferase
MSLEALLEVLVITTTVLFVGFYASYGACCYWYLRKRKTFAVDQIDDSDAPTISVIVPTYNEESVIEHRIENFKSIEYPHDKLQIVIVDASTDSTPEIIERMKDGSLDLTLIKQKERGSYNGAVTAGFWVSSGRIISITGAETEFAPDSLRQMTKHFSKKDVGVVTGRMVTGNQQMVSGKLERAYRDLYDFMRGAESAMDSCFDVKGELNAVRREIVAEILKMREIAAGKGSVDTCFAFQSRMMGMKTVYEPQAIYRENAPARLRESFQQTVRRGQVHIEAMSEYEEMFFNRNLGTFGLLIAPAHLAMVVILPLIFGLQTLSLASLLVIDPRNLLALTLIFLELSAIALSRHAQAFAKIQICLIGAMARLVLGRKTYGSAHTRLASTRRVQEDLIPNKVKE